jgi:hypothetical protein
MRAGYDPTLPGLDEARLDAYRALLTSKLEMLNIALNRDACTPLDAITPEMVEIGDTQTAWDIGRGPLRIRITGGDAEEGLDFESALGMGVQRNVGFKYTFVTHIVLYLHPDALADPDPQRQAEARERTMARINDWITLGVCNYWDPETDTGGLVVTLNSRILTAAPGYDALLESYVRRGYRDWTYRGFGGAQDFPRLHLVVMATVE